MGIKAVTVEKSQINQSVDILQVQRLCRDAEAFTGSGYTAEIYADERLERNTA